jgi:peroxiredoxin
MAQLRHDYDKFEAHGAEILVVCPEDQDEVHDYWRNNRLPFVGLADPDHAAADRFGQQVRLLSLGRMPSVLVIDKAGEQRYRHDASQMWDIPSNREILEVLDDLNPEKK